MGNRAITEPLALTTDYVSIDGRYTDANGNPYASVAAAETALGRRMNQYTVGLTVLVKESGWTEAKEYWVQPKGTMPESYGLVEKVGKDLTKALTLSGEQKYYASANVSDRPADVVIETGVVKSLGYKVLNPAMSFAEQVENVVDDDVVVTDNSNTVFEIRDEYDLNAGTVVVPNGSILQFNGGRLKNGTVNIDGIEVRGTHIFGDNLTIVGKPVGDIYPDMFCDDSDADKIQKCLTIFGVCNLGMRDYIIDKSINVSNSFAIYGVSLANNADSASVVKKIGSRLVATAENISILNITNASSSVVSVLVEGVQFIGHGNTGNTKGIEIYMDGGPSRPITIRNCRFYNFQYGVYSHCTQGSYATNVSVFKVTCCDFTGNNTGIYADGEHAIMNASITDNVMEWNTDCAIKSTNKGFTSFLEVRNNLLEGSQPNVLNIEFGLGNVLIEGNYFESDINCKISLKDTSSEARRRTITFVNNCFSSSGTRYTLDITGASYCTELILANNYGSFNKTINRCILLKEFKYPMAWGVIPLNVVSDFSSNHNYSIIIVDQPKVESFGIVFHKSTNSGYINNIFSKTYQAKAGKDFVISGWIKSAGTVAVKFYVYADGSTTEYDRYFTCNNEWTWITFRLSFETTKNYSFTLAIAPDITGSSTRDLYYGEFTVDNNVDTNGVVLPKAPQIHRKWSIAELDNIDGKYQGLQLMREDDKIVSWNGTYWVDGSGESASLQVSDTSVLIGAAAGTKNISVYYGGITAPTITVLNSDDSANTWLTATYTLYAPTFVANTYYSAANTKVATKPSNWETNYMDYFTDAEATIPVAGVPKNEVVLTADANNTSAPRGAKCLVTLGDELVIINVVQSY